jgi:hypothetical protein
MQNVRTVAQIAQSLGVDPATAVADMLVESGGNNTVTGDNGHSVGLFQLNDGGEGAGMSVAQRQDPTTNATVALTQFAALQGQYSDPGQLAAAAEGPADKPAYAMKVDQDLTQARQLLAQAGVTA